MAAVFELESTLTDRYQTTVPGPVRRALGLGKRDKIRYQIQPDGAVILVRAETQEPDDPVLAQFLRFLARDIKERPQAVRAVDRAWLDEVRSLVQDVEMDLDAPLLLEDE